MKTGKRTVTADVIYIGLFAAMIAVCSWISVPSLVPFTLQTLGVFTAVGVLGGRRGTLAVLVYILLGAMGLPVFSGFAGGVGVIMGSTGGYILGFLFSALTMWLMERVFGRSRAVLLISMIVGLLICYVFGTAWFMAVYVRHTGSVGLKTVLTWCVLPFIGPDIAKILIAMILTDRIARAADKARKNY